MSSSDVVDFEFVVGHMSGAMYHYSAKEQSHSGCPVFVPVVQSDTFVIYQSRSTTQNNLGNKSSYPNQRFVFFTLQCILATAHVIAALALCVSQWIWWSRICSNWSRIVSKLASHFSISTAIKRFIRPTDIAEWRYSSFSFSSVCSNGTATSASSATPRNPLFKWLVGDGAVNDIQFAPHISNRLTNRKGAKLENRIGKLLFTYVMSPTFHYDHF